MSPDPKTAEQDTGLPATDPEMFCRLIDLGIALSAEHHHPKLMEMILLEAKRICNADGGTLYLMSDDERNLSFEIMRNDTLDIAMGGTTGQNIPFPPLSLYKDDGEEPNYANVATSVALRKEMVNILDAYETQDYDFSGTKSFDKNTGYRSTSFLTVPLLNREREVIGVLQLINARDEKNVVVPFSGKSNRLLRRCRAKRRSHWKINYSWLRSGNFWSRLSNSSRRRSMTSHHTPVGIVSVCRRSPRCWRRRLANRSTARLQTSILMRINGTSCILLRSCTTAVR